MESTVEWKPTIKSIIWNMRKKKHSIRTARSQNESKNNEGRLRNLWENFKCTNIQIIGVLEGDRKEQEIENLCEKNNERKFP